MRKLSTRAFFLALLLLAALCATALAGPPDPVQDTGGWVRALYEAATAGQWKVFAGLVMMALVWGIRLVATRVSRWFTSFRGGLVLSGVTALVTTVGVAFAAGVSLSVPLLASAAGTWAAAAGLWHLAKARWPWLSDVLSQASQA